ncbi:glycerophosphodiester phosphodiesterase GDPD5 [Eurytemora carolleeae]|uniref:glycerophosphodiester phosphodiesterase GDPD5 n=1 Tax=Eurytemora carolleeae TaxID=1294199 RepID=UPI000C768CD1|nr:glycerophosphodiester phosphodiesterase GDPD5 [Eurytemora carolleeae]|eukprot:XP_023330055.1 glycerophosphodiester phosphodiesterase GDPD5-like [Eurytemora affinis]
MRSSLTNHASSTILLYGFPKIDYEKLDSFLETSIVSGKQLSKDYKFICAHEPWLSGTTDVSDKAEFEDRKTTYNMDDDDDLINWNDKGNITDWFSFDFTLEELRTLKKYQSQNFRDPRYDLQETVVTLDELVDITREFGLEQGRTIGIYPEMKHCHAVNKILQNRNSSVRFEEIVLQTLNDLGFKSNPDPLVLLLERMIEEKDWERIDNLQLAGLGIDKGVLVTPGVPDEEGRGQYRSNTTQFIAKVHEHGLKAHAFTFRNEWMKLYWDHGQDPYR